MCIYKDFLRNVEKKNEREVMFLERSLKTMSYNQMDLALETSGPEKKVLLYQGAFSGTPCAYVCTAPFSGSLTDRPGHGGRTYVL